MSAQTCTWDQYLARNWDIAPHVFVIADSNRQLLLKLVLSLKLRKLVSRPHNPLLDEPSRLSQNLQLQSRRRPDRPVSPSLSVPETSAAAFDIAGTTLTTAKALVASLQQAPRVAKAIRTTCTLSSQLVQMGDLAGKLGDLETDMRDMINTALDGVTDDRCADVCKLCINGGMEWRDAVFAADDGERS